MLPRKNRIDWCLPEPGCSLGSVEELAPGDCRLASGLARPPAGSFSCQEKKLCGEGCRGKRPGHHLEPLAFRLRSIRIEADRQCLDERRSVGSFE